MYVGAAMLGVGAFALGIGLAVDKPYLLAYGLLAIVLAGRRFRKAERG